MGQVKKVTPGEQNMRSERSALHNALWGGLVLVMIAVGAAGTKSLLRERAATRLELSDGSVQLPIHGLVPDFSFHERSGRKVERADLLGNIWVVNFIYTHCPDTCPLQAAVMAKLQADFRTEPDVRLVSVTVDPTRDTLEVLSRYAERLKADPKRWLFLTGERTAIYRFAMQGLRLPVVDPGDRARGSGGAAFLIGPAPAGAHHEEVSGRLFHSSRFVLVDRKARIRGYYESTDADSLLKLREDMKVLLREE